MATTLQKKSNNITVKQVKPVYGDNYNKGYIGFTYTKGHVIAEGIAYFTRWARMSDIRVTHALMVTGENSCIEARADTNCVQESKLEDYFKKPKCQIFFREPKDLSDEIANRIVETAKLKVGCKYDHVLISFHIITNFIVSKLLALVLPVLPEKVKPWLAERFDNPNKWICSELAANVLAQQPEYQDKVILQRSHATISPQELFEDREIFKPWKDGIPTHCSDFNSLC